MISHTGSSRSVTAIASESLYPYAQEILDKLLLEPMDKILKRSYVAKPSEANRKPARKLIPPDRQEKHVQMNLRISQKDKKVFDRFCKINHLKAREAWGYCWIRSPERTITSSSCCLHTRLSWRKMTG